VRPETHYVRAGEVHLAYQIVGEGPLDLVYVPEFWNSIEAQWDEPSFERFLRRLASFSRLICFDQRGTGLSDPVALSEVATLEQWVDDVRTVMEAAGSKRAALLGVGGGGPLSMLFAATHPERTRALILVNTFARLRRGEDYSAGTSEEFEDRFLEEIRAQWARGPFLELLAPSKADDAEFRAWWARYLRLGGSPGTLLAIRRMLQQVDVRHVLPAIRVPALVLCRAENIWFGVDHGRYLAERIPGVHYVEVPGIDYLPYLGDADAILDEIERFLARARPGGEPERVLTTILFTDLVGSTERAAEVGDRRWAELLESYLAVARRELVNYRGREVDTAGDGFLATFDGPARAIRCALAVEEAARQLGLEVRSGLHTGEVELVGTAVRGIGVHIGARVAALAKPGEVLVSSTVKDLVAGSGLVFDHRGLHSLRGVPGEWHLFAAAGGGA
jgi:pimeloyl-ACP methyl ester carboxylesterase